MSVPRVLFANSTNSPRSSPRLPSTPFNIPKLRSRKSPPTCTVSLANVSSNDCITFSSSLSSSPVANLIPFPSPSTDRTDTSISQPDRTCLSLLRLPQEPLQPPTEPTSPVAQTLPERRKRSTSRLLQPVVISQVLVRSAASEPSNQPPRKRPRLLKAKTGKSTKKTSCFSPSDLRFLANVQRSIASRVTDRQKECRSQPVERSEQSLLLETQDILLASRLRTLLLDRGFKVSDVIDLNNDQMDVDTEAEHPTSVSIDMDIDVETPVGSRLPSPPSCPRQLSPSEPKPLSTLPNLVATLFLRHHTRKSSRSSAGSERSGVTREKLRKSSPLAHLIDESSDC